MITQVLQAVIPTGAGGAAPVVDIGADYRMVGLEMSSAWTAGDISIVASSNPSGSLAVYLGDAADNQILLKVAASRRVGLSGDQQIALLGARYISLVSVANQGAARTVGIVAVLDH